MGKWKKKLKKKGGDAKEKEKISPTSENVHPP